jgi:asparagine synthase (glutamine-hydrolysing)
MLETYTGRLVNLLDPAQNRLYNISLDEAIRRVRGGNADEVRAIDGSFAIVTIEGTRVRMARSLDRPIRYFLAKRREGPALFVADRIDALHGALAREGLDDQFHPSYTRMVPAHYVVELALTGCPDPDPTYTRFFLPQRNSLPADLDEIGRRYVGALAAEIRKWLESLGPREPIGVAFSGGIDSGSVLLVVYHEMVRLGCLPSRLKAFVLNLGGGQDVAQARSFLEAVGLPMLLEEIDASPNDLDVAATLRTIEDYKRLDVECAAMGLLLCRGIRARYPDWRHMADGDGGDENLKDYPIEENPELTIRSVVDNLMLYHEGWGVGRLKHSLTYSGGLSRSYARTYAPARQYGFDGFSPYTRPSVIEVAEGIPFATLTQYDVPTLYSLKGDIVRRGIKALTGLNMPVYEKRRFQHGTTLPSVVHERIGEEHALRRAFHAIYESARV